MAGSEAPALRKPPATATPIRLPLPRQSPTLPFSATDPLLNVTCQRCGRETILWATETEICDPCVTKDMAERAAE